MEGKFLCASVMKNGDEIHPNYYEYDSILNQVANPLLFYL